MCGNSCALIHVLSFVISRLLQSLDVLASNEAFVLVARVLTMPRGLKESLLVFLKNDLQASAVKPRVGTILVP